MRWLFSIAILALACSSQPSSTPPPQEPKDCVTECERQTMMRAVSREMIRADCERECAEKPDGSEN